VRPLQFHYLLMVLLCHNHAAKSQTIGTWYILGVFILTGRLGLYIQYRDEAQGAGRGPFNDRNPSSMSSTLIATRAIGFHFDAR